MRFLTMILSVTFAIQFSFSSAQAEMYSKDVNDPHFIKVSAVDGKYLLQICKTDDRTKCQQLGNRPYTNKELTQIKRQLILAGGGRALAGAIIVAGATVAAGYVGGVAAVSMSGPEMGALINLMLGQILGYGAGFAGGVVTVAKTMNPLNQFRAAEVVGISNLQGQEIRVNSRMNYMAALIDEKLKTLDSDQSETAPMDLYLVMP
ncbi:MAG: hypothetical protein BroJett040_04580 [Oligoflexia bacterium]|nr:MAG: hypothetical protein BroJett040_04580 [Oligoflexia bacterium]